MVRMALVVDDSMLIRHTITRFLEERGFAVESAANGQEAMEVLRTLSPDLIITDLQMPKMNGMEFITQLKSSPLTAGIPIVILQGKPTSEQRQVAEVRADCAIYKDIDIVAQLDKALKLTMGNGC